MPEDREASIARGEDAPLRVDNPRGIRAWAHPARLAILDALSTGDELTATECAQVTGLSASATAYHMKFLERYRLIEPASQRPDHRERAWRLTERRITVDLDASTPAAASATAAVTGAYFELDPRRGHGVHRSRARRARGLAGCRCHEHRRPVDDGGGDAAGGARVGSGARAISRPDIAWAPAGQSPRPGDERRRSAPSHPSGLGFRRGGSTSLAVATWCRALRRRCASPWPRC